MLQIWATARSLFMYAPVNKTKNKTKTTEYAYLGPTSPPSCLGLFRHLGTFPSLPLAEVLVPVHHDVGGSIKGRSRCPFDAVP